jgi:hypothetical protein
MSGSAPPVLDAVAASGATIPLVLPPATSTAGPAKGLASIDDGRHGAAPWLADDSPGRSSSTNRGLIRETHSAVQRLFDSLREKDPATATHSLRTTLGCGQWSHELELTPDVRDALQMAALLHDVGKIVVPRRVLDKPTALTEE